MALLYHLPAPFILIIFVQSTPVAALISFLLEQPLLLLSLAVLATLFCCIFIVFLSAVTPGAITWWRCRVRLVILERKSLRVAEG